MSSAVEVLSLQLQWNLKCKYLVAPHHNNEEPRKWLNLYSMQRNTSLKNCDFIKYFKDIMK